MNQGAGGFSGLSAPFLFPLPKHMTSNDPNHPPSVLTLIEASKKFSATQKSIHAASLCLSCLVDRLDEIGFDDLLAIRHLENALASMSNAADAIHDYSDLMGEAIAEQSLKPDRIDIWEGGLN